MYGSAKGKLGLVYQPPGNCDTARSHDEVEKTGESLKEGLAHKEEIYPKPTPEIGL